VELARLRAEGHTVHGVPHSELIIHLELEPVSGMIHRQRVVAFEWRGGPHAASAVGLNHRGDTLFVDLGPVVGKGRLVADGIVELPAFPLDGRTVRVRRTGRRLSWWAARVVARKRDPFARVEMGAAPCG
jgi:hypothetical protein